MANSTITHLTAKNGAKIKFNRLVVCAQSPVLNARLNGGDIGIDVNHEEHVVQQMVDWMHGIRGENHLTGGLSVDEISATSPKEVSTKISALVEVGSIATEYEIVALRERVIELIDQLVLNLTSVKDIHTVIYELAPKKVPPILQQALVLRADFHNERQLKALNADARRSSTSCDRTTSMDPYPPLPMYRPPASMFRQLSARAPSSSSTSTSSAKKRGAICNDSTQDPPTMPSNDEDDDDDDDDDDEGEEEEEQEEEEEATSPSPPTSPTTKRQRTIRKEPADMSTALPINNPRLGDHCECLVDISDPTLVLCKGCGKYYHPRCHGKGIYAPRSYASDSMHHMKKDVKFYKAEEFYCRNCKPGFFDGAPGKRRMRNSMGGSTPPPRRTTT